MPAPGSAAIASALIRTDPQSPLIPIVLETAAKTIRSPRSSRTDRFVAVKLTVEKGTETQFSTLFEHFRAAQRNDTKLYSEIFALMREDRRIFWGERRYCDLGGANLQLVAKEGFGFTNDKQPLAERDRAVEKAASWAKRQNLK